MGPSWERKCKFVSTNLWTVTQVKRKPIELNLVSEISIIDFWLQFGFRIFSLKGLMMVFWR